MTDTLEPVAAAKEDLDQEQLAQQLLAQAKEQGVELVGPDGLLNQLTKRVLETALEEEMSEHLGYDKHDPVGRNHDNSRNGVRSKTVLTEIGPVEIDVPRDVDASLAVVQACIIHLIRNTFRFASRKYWDQIAHDLRPVYTAASEAEALARFEEFEEKWGTPYPAISRLWRNAWTEFVPFLDYDVEIRKIICSTNAIESINARYRRAVRARGHFPSDQAALKCLYLVTRSLDPTGKGRARWAMSSGGHSPKATT